ncbi:MAG: GIY-YIG nuclease family protein [Nanoarchaeota archaeon]|nr:GIY-YIG nuclease family protein [Nanoarchaeota archaeon]
MSKMYYVYVLKCEGDRYYIGHTSNLKRRIQEHMDGTGARFTSMYKPEKLVYLEKCESRKEAKEKENIITLEVLLLVGDVEKVAGGDYPQAHKPKEVKIQMIKNALALKRGELLI